MNRPRFLLALSSCLAGFLTGAPASSLERPRVIVNPGIVVSGREEALRAAENLYRELLGNDDPSRLELARAVSLRGGAQVAQFDQVLDGHRIFGAGLNLALDGGGRASMAVSGLVPTAGVEKHAGGGPLSDALVVAESAFLSAGGKLLGPARGEQAWIRSGGALYLVNLATVRGDRPFAEVTYLVAGEPPRVLFAVRRTPAVLGYAYPQNPVEGAYEQVELLHLTSSEHLTGEHVTFYNCTGSDNCSSKQQLAVPVNGDYLIEPAGANDPALVNDTFVEVQAYYGINTVHDYFVAMGWNPSPIEVQVNFPMTSPNAYYDDQNQQIVMGQSGTIDLAVENDVIFHEYGHHVFGEVSQAGMFVTDDYGFFSHGLAVNEATADYYSCSALDDPEMGEYFAQQMGAIYFPDGWLRNVDNELTCPWGLYGEAHDDSQIWSGFLWDARGLLGRQVADEIYMEALAAFPQSVTFPAVTDVYLQAAAARLDQATVDSLRLLAAERGLLDCERFIELRQQPHTGLVWGKELLGGYGAGLAFIPGELHYFIEVPQQASQLSLQLTARPAGVDLAILVREDQRIEHRISMMPPSITSSYDFILEQPGIWNLPSADPPFQAGHTYYLQVVNQGQATAEYNISGFVVVESPDGGQDGGADAGQDGGAAGGGDAVSDGGDGIPTCPEGWELAGYEGELVCVPICREDYEPKLEGDTWVCAPIPSGCGCASAGASSAAAALVFALLFAWGVRRRS